MNKETFIKIWDETLGKVENLKFECSPLLREHLMKIANNEYTDDEISKCVSFRDSDSKTIDQRILAIEKVFNWADGIQGTTITRILTKDQGQIWSIGFGAMHQPKHFFEGLTIEEALTNAENVIFNQS